MIDLLITALQILRLQILFLGCPAGVLLMISIFLPDLSYAVSWSGFSLPKRRVGRHRRTISRAISEHKLSRAKTQQKVEEYERGDGFFGEFYASGFDTDGGLICRDTKWFSTEKFRRHYRKLEGLTNKQIFKPIEVL